MSAFEQLRRDDEPMAPDTGFAARLRARLAELLGADPPTIDLPERRTSMATATTPTANTPTSITAGTTTPATAESAPATGGVLVPYICVAGAAAALDWYADAFGAVETVRYVGDDGRIGHAEITIEGARLMVSDVYEGFGVGAPEPGAPAAVSLNLNVADVDAFYARAIATGATSQREPADQEYGERSCTIVDPFGHRWMIQTTVAHLTTAQINAAMEGFTAVEGATVPAASTMPAAAPVELGYVTLGTDDTITAGRFYGALFGWEVEPGHMGDQYAHVNNTALPLGFTPEGSDTAPVLYFRVDDIAAYVDRVRELGGTVVEQTTYESGPNATCRDDQGRQFQLWQPAPGY